MRNPEIIKKGGEIAGHQIKIKDNSNAERAREREKSEKELRLLLRRTPKCKKIDTLYQDKLTKEVKGKYSIGIDKVTLTWLGKEIDSVVLAQDKIIEGIKNKKEPAVEKKDKVETNRTVEQIAMLIAERGDPNEITWEFTKKKFKGDKILKRTFNLEKKQVFPFEEIRIIVLEEAQKLDINFAGLSLEMIGKYLIEKVGHQRVSRGKETHTIFRGQTI